VPLLVPALERRLKLVEAKSGERRAYRKADHQYWAHLDLLQL